MQRPHSGALLLAALWLLVYPASTSAELSLSSNPEHVQVRVQGGVVLQGNTPISFQGVPTGDYRLKVDGRGVAVAQGRLRLSPEGELAARPWAGPDVLLLAPGFAHLLRGERWRGWILLGGGAGSFAMTLVTGADSRDADAELRLSQIAYDAAQSEEGIALASANLRRASQKADDTLLIRNLWIGCFAATWVWAATEAWLSTARPKIQATSDGNYLLEVPRASGWSAVWRSALVPGSGQRYLGRTRRGNLFAAGVLLFGASSIVAQESYMKAKRDYANADFRYGAAQTPEEVRQSAQALWDASRTLDDENVIRWTFAGLTAGMYLWNILDATTGGQELAEPKNVELGVVPQPGGFQAALSWRLP